MHYKIYFDHKPLFLADQIDKEIEPFTHHDDTVLIDEFSTPALHALIHEMHQPKIHAGIFVHQDLAQLRKAFWKKFTLVPAAGSLVLNEQEQLLFIFRKGKWDLPKGKREAGESPETCALRETAEETGLTNLSLIKPLCTTFHTYVENGKALLKETAWYSLKASGPQELVPQIAEQITDITWADPKALAAYKANTYLSILDVLKAAGY